MGTNEIHYLQAFIVAVLSIRCRLCSDVFVNRGSLVLQKYKVYTLLEVGSSHVDHF
jgi:hypothetical protein